MGAKPIDNHSTSERAASSPVVELSPRKVVAEAIAYLSDIEDVEELKALVEEHYTLLTYEELFRIHRVIALIEFETLIHREIVKLEVNLLHTLAVDDEDEEEDTEEPEFEVSPGAVRLVETEKADGKSSGDDKPTDDTDDDEPEPPEAPKPEPAAPPKGKDKPDGSAKEPEKDDTTAWFDELAGEKEAEEAGPEEPKPAAEEPLAPAAKSSATVEEILAMVNREAGNGINGKKPGQEFGRVGQYYLARADGTGKTAVCVYHDDYPGNSSPVIVLMQGQWKPTLHAELFIRQFVIQVNKNAGKAARAAVASDKAVDAVVAWLADRLIRGAWSGTVYGLDLDDGIRIEVCLSPNRDHLVIRYADAEPWMQATRVATVENCKATLSPNIERLVTDFLAQRNNPSSAVQRAKAWAPQRAAAQRAEGKA